MIQRAGLGFLYHGEGPRGLLHPWQRQWSWQCNKNKHMQAGSLFGWEWWLACCLSQPNKSPYRAKRWVPLISFRLATDASDRLPPLRPLIYHEQARGEVPHCSKAKIARGRGDAKTGGREGENEIKKGEKKRHIGKQRAKADNAEI